MYLDDELAGELYDRLADAESETQALWRKAMLDEFDAMGEGHYGRRLDRFEQTIGKLIGAMEEQHVEL
jgi:hypothetical protein